MLCEFGDFGDFFVLFVNICLPFCIWVTYILLSCRSFVKIFIFLSNFFYS